MTNNLFEARLSEKSIANLRQLVGLPIYRIQSPSLDVRGSIITSFSLSLSLERNDYLVIDSERLETANDFTDYFQLSAEFSETPKYIEVETNARGTKYFTSQVSSIELLEWAESVSPIARFKVYELENGVVDRSGDIAIYDCAILFICENNKRFCIATSKNVPSALDFTQQDNAINFMLKGGKLRSEIS
jgi:hypothetical protein